MSISNEKHRISVTVDPHLLQAIDEVSTDRSAVVEEGLKLWYQHYIEDQLHNFYRQEHQNKQQLNQDWAEFAQGEMEAILEVEGL